jgi:replication factor C subunit 1
VTSYVVLGADAGPSKLKTIEKHKLKTLNEDEFLNLIATRQGPSGSNGDAKFKKKMEKEEQAIRAAAKEMELMEAKAAKKQATADTRGFVPDHRLLVSRIFNHPNDSSKSVDISSQLWTSRYAPQKLKDICGNKGQIEKLQQWLHDWSVSGRHV